MRSHNILGLSDLTFRYSAGKLARHAELNDVVKMALQTSWIPCLLKPPDLSKVLGLFPACLFPAGLFPAFFFPARRNLSP